MLVRILTVTSTSPLASRMASCISVADVVSLMQCSFMSVMIAPLGTMVSVVFTRSVSCWTTHGPVVLSVSRRYHVDLL